MTTRTKSLVPVILFLIPLAALAENVRGPVVDNVILDSTSDSHVATVGLEDLIGVSLGDGNRFIKGVELDITVPPAARRYRNLLGLYIYKRVTPSPSSSADLYSGSRAGFIVLPAVSKIYVNIPVKVNAVQPSAETITLDNPIPAGQFPLIVTVLPVAKGLPSSVSDSKFTIKVSPILEDKGLLKLNVTEDGKTPEFPYALSIDDRPTAVDPLEYELDSGIHHLSVTSRHYKEVNKTFGIDKGRTTTVDISLERLVPKVLFEAPDNAEIFLDGQKLQTVPKKPMTVTEGQHTVIIREGDYSLTKKFSVERGKSYKVSLFLDILVQEN